MTLIPNGETLSFISIHKTDDVRQLALKSRPDGVDMAYALEQIAGWQAARRKLPSWADTDGLVFPPHLSMEQCSSEPTAVYKQRLAERLADGNAERHVDLTGGFGVDFSFMSRGFRHKTYVERQETLCRVVAHNMPLLGVKDAEIVCGDTEEYLLNMPHATTIFIDPARRDDHGGRTFAIADCTPDVVALKGELLAHADYVVVKLSPMLDWHKAVADLGNVSEVHIISVKNECKELLLVLSAGGGRQGGAPLHVCCVDCQQLADGSWHYVSEEYTDGGDICALLPCSSPSAVSPSALLQPGCWIYEPNASIMKAGCFAMISARYGMPQVAQNSHLFLSESLVEAFPGRRFQVCAVTELYKKALRQALSGIAKANVTVRNFPLSVADLRKKLKIKDGGDTYIFATTLADSRHVLIITKKAPAQ